MEDVVLRPERVVLIDPWPSLPVGAAPDGVSTWTDPPSSWFVAMEGETSQKQIARGTKDLWSLPEETVRWWVEWAANSHEMTCILEVPAA